MGTLGVAKGLGAGFSINPLSISTPLNTLPPIGNFCINPPKLYP